VGTQGGKQAARGPRLATTGPGAGDGRPAGPGRHGGDAPRERDRTFTDFTAPAGGRCSRARIIPGDPGGARGRFYGIRARKAFSTRAANPIFSGAGGRLGKGVVRWRGGERCPPTPTGGGCGRSGRDRGCLGTNPLVLENLDQTPARRASPGGKGKRRVSQGGPTGAGFEGPTRGKAGGPPGRGGGNQKSEIRGPEPRRAGPRRQNPGGGPRPGIHVSHPTTSDWEKTLTRAGGTGGGWTDPGGADLVAAGPINVGGHRDHGRAPSALFKPVGEPHPRG